MICDVGYCDTYRTNSNVLCIADRYYGVFKSWFRGQKTRGNTPEIPRLESHLRDLAYGKRLYRYSETEQPPKEQEYIESGQNLLELSFSKLVLTKDAIKLMQAADPTVFLTMEFFDFEIQFTPIMKGHSVEMDFTCQYSVSVSDLFLYFLQTDTLTVELHQAFGTSYRTWAAGSISLKELLHGGTIAGSLQLFGTSSTSCGLLFGQADFSVSFKVPIQRSISFYKERTEALGYVLSDQIAAEERQTANQLQITVHRCRDFKSSVAVSEQESPSSYVVYQFFDFNVHDTKVVPKDKNPQFADQMLWPVPVGKHLHNYLRSKSIQFLVFDDDAHTDHSSYVGSVSVALLPLIHDKPITGTFQLCAGGDLSLEQPIGTIDISIMWKYTYIPPKDELFVSQPLLKLEPETDLPKVLDNDVETVGVSSVKVSAVKKEKVLPQPDAVLPVLSETDEIVARVETTATEQHRPRSDSYTISKSTEEVEKLEGDTTVKEEGTKVADSFSKTPARISSFEEAKADSQENRDQTKRVDEAGDEEEDSSADEDVVVQSTPPTATLSAPVHDIKVLRHVIFR